MRCGLLGKSALKPVISILHVSFAYPLVRVPCSTSCQKTMWACIYLPEGHTIQDRGTRSKALGGGVNSPWQITRPRLVLPAGRSLIDPFDSLPIKMSKKSLELWKRCQCDRVPTFRIRCMFG